MVRSSSATGASTGGPREMAWQPPLYALLRERGVDLIAYVPDAGHDGLIARALADPAVTAVALTTEEEGVALMAGAELGGRRAVLLMQSSGVGNCVNMLSLIRSCRFPFLALVTMRGTFGEGNPWQYPMGQATQAVLEAMGVICLVVRREDEVLSTARAATIMAYQSGYAIAVLLTQELIGAKPF